VDAYAPFEFPQINHVSTGIQLPEHKKERSNGMKITAIKTSTLKIPNPPPRNTYYACNIYVVAKIHTDEGIEGLGYTMLVGGDGASSVRAYLDDNIVPRLIGKNPLQIGKIWEEMYDADRGLRKKGIPVYAISLIDIGLWDILGKSVGKPIWQLLGACRDRVPVYGGGGFLSYTVADLIKEAENALAMGCRHYKMKIGLPDIMENVNRVKAVRKAVGDKVRLIVDANQRWDVQTNIRVGKMLEEYDIFWYEEPVYADNIRGCAEVARRINIPVATGENEYTRYGFRDLIEQKAATILNPDITRCGGFSEMMKIAHLAAAYDVKIAPHVVPELSLHVGASIPNVLLLEWSIGRPTGLWRDDPQVVDGAITVPDRPGHGMEFTKTAIRKYQV
jgi:L-alanine-DL-glutamate epimerase-like enolase superfamily enzyme